MNSTITAVPFYDEKTATASPCGTSGSNRIESIDIFRGLTVVVMVFVNDLSDAPTFEWPFDPGLSFITMAGLVASLLFFETPLAAAWRANGYPPLLLDLEADRDTDHVIAIYRTDGCWGAVAQSNYTGCRWPEPVYRSLRELALSYFSMRGERTLRRFSRPVNLKRFDRQQWMTSDKLVWFIVYHLFDIKHYSRFTRVQEKRLHRVDERLLQAECLGKALKGNGWRGAVRHNSAVPNILRELRAL
jgi:hypothetical protein